MTTENTRTPVTVPTTDKIAQSLTSGDNDYHEGYDWKESLTSDGNVLHVTITPFDEDGEPCAKVRFEAHVFPVEPSPPVASEPVELPVEVARELAYDGVGGSDYDQVWTVVADVAGEASRWYARHQLVIRNEAGEHFAADYRRGLTETQDIGLWEGEKTVTFEPVERRTRVVQTVEWVTPTAEQGEQPATGGDA